MFSRFRRHERHEMPVTKPIAHSEQRFGYSQNASLFPGFNPQPLSPRTKEMLRRVQESPGAMTDLQRDMMYSKQPLKVKKRSRQDEVAWTHEALRESF